jgi:hypothetical protein
MTRPGDAAARPKWWVQIVWVGIGVAFVLSLSAWGLSNSHWLRHPGDGFFSIVGAVFFLGAIFAFGRKRLQQKQLEDQIANEGVALSERVGVMAKYGWIGYRQLVVRERALQLVDTFPFRFTRAWLTRASDSSMQVAFEPFPTLGLSPWRRQCLALTFPDGKRIVTLWLLSTERPLWEIWNALGAAGVAALGPPPD